jgi:hypothetical protein
VDITGAEEWIREHVEPAGAIETEHERSWSATDRPEFDTRFHIMLRRGIAHTLEPRL